MLAMAQLVDRICEALDAQIEQLCSLVEEFERLQRAALALARFGPRAVPRVGAPCAPLARPATRASLDVSEIKLFDPGGVRTLLS